jgi:hypothetical protein
VSIVIKCVIGSLLVTDLNKVQEGRVEGSKSDSKAFGDYFVVSQRQKDSTKIKKL